MKPINLIFSFILFFCVSTYSQGPNSCACVWSDPYGNINCVYGNCGGGNWNNCYNQVSTPNLWANSQCPIPPNSNCNPYMWNTGLNGSCWYQGGGCSGQSVCEYLFEPLPIELIRFDVNEYIGNNIITWETATESNSERFFLYSFNNYGDTINIVVLPGSGNSSSPKKYTVTHNNPPREVNYYFLIQTDFDGDSDSFGPVSIDNRIEIKKIIRRTNLIGQDVGENYTGHVLIIYDDGSVNRTYNYPK